MGRRGAAGPGTSPSARTETPLRRNRGNSDAVSCNVPGGFRLDFVRGRPGIPMSFRAKHRRDSDVVSCRAGRRFRCDFVQGAGEVPMWFRAERPWIPPRLSRHPLSGCPGARTAFPARHPKILCAVRRHRPKACPPGRQDIRRKTHVRPVRHLPASELSCTIASRILTKSFPAAELFGPFARVDRGLSLLHEGASELGEILLPGTARCKVGFPPGHPADIPAGQRGRTAQGTAPRDPPLTRAGGDPPPGAARCGAHRRIPGRRGLT